MKPKSAFNGRRRPAAHALAHSLLGAAAAIAGVRTGRSLTDVLAARQAGQTAEARGAVQALSFDAMRGLGRALALKTALVPQPVADPQIDALLVLALQLLSEPDCPYAPHTVVDQAVEAAGTSPRTAGFKPLVNAVLRRFLRGREARLETALQNPEAAWNYPAWWIARVRAAYPDAWQSILAAGNERPPMTLRVNRRRTSVQDYAAQLQAAGLGVRHQWADALVLDKPVPVDALPGFHAGLCSVQDAGAQLAGPLLTLRPGQRVLDACAAPGGKTTHALELAEVEMLAIDSDASRLARVAENLERLGLAAALQAADAAEPGAWWDGRPFDRILLDAPCTASGIVRRHPDLRWLRREQDVAQLAEQQSALLRRLWPLVAPGGKLLFVTCSIFPEEGLEQAHRFAHETPDARLLPAPGQLLPQSNSTSPACPVPHDGFFYASFEKR